MTYYTHAGLFHADEVFGFAICLLAGVCDKFHRVTDLKNIPDDGLVADIGREWKPDEMKFDHHQGFFQRDNGVPYASAGMLWKQFGHMVIVNNTSAAGATVVKEIQNRVDEILIQGIDAHDSDNQYYHEATCSAGKVRAVTISNMIAMLNYDDPSDHEAQHSFFLQASSIAQTIILKSVYAAEKHIQAKSKFSEVARVDGPVITLSEGLPWKEIVHESHPDAMFVISPSNHPGNPFSMIAVPVDPDKREIKKPIERPDWFSGFIHQGKWIAGGESVEQLMELANFNLE